MMIGDDMYSGKNIEPSNKPQHTKCTVKSSRIVVIEDSFPVISETFILEQITGLMDRGFNIENWALNYLDQGVLHSKVIEYDLIKNTHYLKLPAPVFRSNPAAWSSELSRYNDLGDLTTIRAFHVNYGTNFIVFEPLFQALDAYLIVSFYGYDASKYIIENGDDCYDTLFKRANLITTNTICMMKKLIRIGCPEHKIKVIRCGVDIPDNSVQYNNDNTKIRLLTVARLVEKKGIEFALQALALCPVRTNIKYRIIGDGPLNDELRHLATQLGIDDQVEFLGFLPVEKMLEEMRQADIVILTSVTAANGDQEGLPVTLVTAQAMGLPVISSYHSGIEELVIHGVTGLLSQEREVNQIAIHIQMLVNNSNLRRSFGTNGRERVITEFDMEKNIDQLARLLMDGVNSKHCRKAPGVECPICGGVYDSFASYGVEPRPNALCPGCQSLERHRLLWLFLKEKTNLFTSPRLKVLDIAPVPFLSERIKRIPFVQYLSIDIHSPYAMRKMDITNLLLPDDYFDCILCYHVLEHVPNDHKAISELYRVMKPGGWGIIQVPLKPGLENTIEDLNITNPQERLRLYGNEDHVRYYGLDFKDRLESTGFNVLIDQFAKTFSEDYVQKFSISQCESIYFSSKQIDKSLYNRIINSTSEKVFYKSAFISILIPTYNRVRYLADAIKSALSQNYDNFEVVIVDDGSTDNTAALVASFVDPKLRYILKAHSGAPATRNRCIDEARGELLVWLDSDDVLYANTLSVYAAALEKTPDAEVVYGDLDVSNDTLQTTSEIIHKDWYGKNDLLIATLFNGNCIPNPGTMVRKSCYVKFGGYNETFRRAHDYEFWSRIAKTAKFKHVPFKTLKWRWHNSNMSSGSVICDTTFEGKVIIGMLNAYNLMELLPEMPWTANPHESLINAWLNTASRLMQLNYVDGTIYCMEQAYQLSSNSDIYEIIIKLNSTKETTQSDY